MSDLMPSMLSATESSFFWLTTPAAQLTEKTTGIRASITLAQAILESGWGNSKLARVFNNYFGIKASQSQIAAGHYCEFDTEEEINGTLQEIRARFAEYTSPTDSFLAHAHLIASFPRYDAAMLVRADVDAFAWALGPKTLLHPEGCGYSTLGTYHDRLMQLIHQFNLTQYDEVAA